MWELRNATVGAETLSGCSRNASSEHKHKTKYSGFYLFEKEDCAVWCPVPGGVFLEFPVLRQCEEEQSESV